MATFSDVSNDVGTNAIARAISAYSDQEYTDAVRIAGTGLIGSDARISGSEEDYFGSIRWTRTLGALMYNTASRTSPGEVAGGLTAINYGDESDDHGATTGVQHDSSQYIKTLRTMGAQEFNVTQILTAAPNSIEKVSRDFGITRARDNDAALMAMLQGVTAAEVARRIDDGTTTATLGAANVNTRYGQGLGDSLNKDAGFYFDCNGPMAEGVTRTSNAGTAGDNSLIDAVTATSRQGGAAGSRLWEAASAAFGDLEPDFFYLVIGTRTYHAIRSANLLDNQDRITDGNIQVDTLLGGKFRLLVTRSLDTGFDFSPTGSTPSANDAVNQGSVNTSYLMLPGALYQSDVVVPNPVAFDADESIGRGTGNRELWYRWANIYHPQGYTWSGSTGGFATNDLYETAASWQRKEMPGNLGILPIFHA